ncbi:hypothetical protein [Roseovarius sp.]|uniref:hypothetical protein n=1 Tax=Roseovarius sp. TaxID=1486281 RepID=UPI003BAB0DAB
MKTVFFLAMTFGFLGTVVSAQMADCNYDARFYGTTGTIKVAGGQPVAYWTPRYTASNVYMQDDTIFIDQATLSNVIYGKNQNGHWSFQGDWKLGSRSKKDVVFVCR